MRKLLLIIFIFAMACSCFGWKMQRDYETIIDIDTLTATSDGAFFSTMDAGMWEIWITYTDYNAFKE